MLPYIYEDLKEACPVSYTHLGVYSGAFRKDSDWIRRFRRRPCERLPRHRQGADDAYRQDDQYLIGTGR